MQSSSIDITIMLFISAFVACLLALLTTLSRIFLEL
jgi:hypothetical protein